jgi:hypothetical protein
MRLGHDPRFCGGDGALPGGELPAPDVAEMM